MLAAFVGTTVLMPGGLLEYFGLATPPPSANKARAALASSVRRPEAHTKTILVVYSGPTDPTGAGLRVVSDNFLASGARGAIYHRNLDHFLRCGVAKPGHHRHITTAVVITNDTRALLEPTLRKHEVEVFYRRNVCYDMESYRLVLEHMAEQRRTFSYYIMLNCGIFGPSLPAYLLSPHAPHWAEIVSWHITNATKLVGMYVGDVPPGDPGVLGKFRWPGIASEFWATDSLGLSFIQSDKVIFKCSQQVEGLPRQDVYENELCVRYEMGLSRAMHVRGYNIAGLNAMQHGADWRLPGQGGGFGQGDGLVNPGSYYKGSTPGPLDFLFLKMTRPPPTGARGTAELQHLRHLMPLYDPETRDTNEFHKAYGFRIYRHYNLERRTELARMTSWLKKNLTQAFQDSQSFLGLEDYERLKDGWRPPRPHGR